MRYVGWIHVRGEIEGPREGWGEIHVGPAGGTRVVAEHGPDGLEVRMDALAGREKVTYSARDDTVRFARLSDEEVARWDEETRGGFPLTLEDVLTGWPGARVTRSREEGLERHELSPQEGAGVIPGATKACEGCARAGLTSAVVWTDPESGLIRRAELRFEGRSLACRYSYGEPGVRDVYDLGVPRETRVIDER